MTIMVLPEQSSSTYLKEMQRSIFGKWVRMTSLIIDSMTEKLSSDLDMNMIWWGTSKDVLTNHGLFYVTKSKRTSS